MQVLIESLGVLGPGLPDWASASNSLQHPVAWQPAELAIPAPAGLAGAERRRVSQAVKVAMAVAHEACANSRFDPAMLPSIFSSSGGDGQNCHILCEALSEADPQISPTRFTNSVHNAPSGYWSISTGSQQASNSLCGFDGSFAAGLLEAALLSESEQTPVLLVAYDVCYPAPLSAVRRIDTPFGIAMVLSPASTSHADPCYGRIQLELNPDEPETRLGSAALESLRTGAPAARCLPLLELIAGHRAASVVLPAPGGQKISLRYQPQENAGS
ncbi:MAG: beta-ketoacyl synthase chain length factor [Burkholderiaceae bacterium]